MSTGEEDRIARSVALEKTYVHDVYDHMSALQYPEHRNTTPWPKVKRFLNELEPGSIVCDVGCGNGKYLKVNPSIFKIGSDRCRKLTQIAKDDDNEVLLCDNLTLPFRDESFDAVLSIAVIHHFATKERRVGALRELARVLRIGGRLMITVWAMEQKDRKFETQDVLVQWHHPQFVRTPSLEFSTTATVTSELDDFALACRLSQTQVSDDNDSLYSGSSSFRQDTRPGRSRLRLFQSLRSIKTSPSSSSLSSPNETCYSFVKKALQKLSRSNKKEKHQTRAWFLESWASSGKDDHLPATRYDPEGCEEDTINIQDLPIELRRMENETELQRSESTTEPAHLLQVSLTQKSKSLNDIQSQATTSAPIPITRSRSSIVTAEEFIRLKSTTTATATAATTKPTINTELLVDTLKPKLVKQKKSICEEEYVLEEDESRDKATDMKTLVKELPMFNISIEKPTEKYNVLKQKSLTEDIMSTERLRERERVRQNIQKQASLNENLIRKRTSDSFKDTFLTSSSRKFQMFRSGLTSKLKSSTTNIEVTGSSLKSGIARIFHSLTGGEESAEPAPIDVAPVQPTAPPSLRKSSSEDRGDNYLIERRFSHEENSDSSKDNSLQSDTSIDSEDSIISVIERTIPKPTDQSTSPTMLTSPGPHTSKMALTGVLSHPSSPKISQVMQYPAAKAKALSLPASPRTIVLSPGLKQTFKLPPVTQLSTNGNGTTIITPNGKSSASGLASSNGATTSPLVFRDLKPPSEDEPILKLSPIEQVTAAKLKTFTNKDMMLLTQKLTVLSSKEKEPRGDVCEGDESQKSDTEQSLITMKIRPTKPEEHLSRSKSESSARAAYALVKKATSTFHTFSQSHQARLQSYEIFNPETEDIDTDSSGVSTPDSFGSVISVKMDSSNGTPLTEIAQSEITEIKLEESVDVKDEESSKLSSVQAEAAVQLEPEAITKAEFTHEAAITKISDEALLVAAVSEVSSLESAVDSVMKQRTGGIAVDVSTSDRSVKSASPPPSPQPSTSKAKETRRASAPSARYIPATTTAATTSSSSGKSPGEHETWDRECRQHIVDLAENLSERLLAEIDRYRELNINVDESSSSSSSSRYSKSDATDPYLTRLSEELSHVSKLTRELSEDLDARGTVSTRIEIETSRMEVISVEEEQGEIEKSESEAMLDPNDLNCEQSTEAESPGSISGWLDSRRNTIESGVRRRDTEESKASISSGSGTSDQLQADERRVSTTEKGDEGVEEQHPLLLLQQKSVSRRRKLSKSSEGSATTSRLSTESTDTMDVSERTVSSDDGHAGKRDTMPTESSGRLSIESDLGEIERGVRNNSVETKYSGSQASLRPGESIESSDAGDISERTASVSDFSRQNTESRSVITQSSASLASWSDCSKDIRFADRRTNRCDGRSSSEETNPRAMLIRQEAATQEPMDVKMPNTGTSLSRSTSQDSLTSESGGGSIMFHRYYHVFREGELDSLIDEFVENLHIISSYYDHTNWCIIAEKVRVWTI